MGLATAARLPDLEPDDQFLVAALRQRGLDVAPVVWDDPSVDWSHMPLVVVRTTWDYWERLPDFVAWADHVESVTRLRNPADVIRWNGHKGYLRELAARGVPTVPTVWLDRGEVPRLDAIAAAGWERVVVKPAVSAGARNTWLTTPTSLAGDERERLAQLVASDDVMVQPYLERVQDRGEVSLLAVRGEVTHCVRKVPAPGDFRVQDDFGGTYSATDPTTEELAIAAAALAATPQPTLYGRVDLLPGPEGEPLLVELEVIEPSLFLGSSPEGTTRLADAIVEEVRRSSPRTHRRRS